MAYKHRQTVYNEAFHRLKEVLLPSSEGYREHSFLGASEGEEMSLTYCLETLLRTDLFLTACKSEIEKFQSLLICYSNKEINSHYLNIILSLYI